MTPYYDDGGITIYHGDCADVLPGLSPDDFAVMLTDPPYGIGYRSTRPVAGARRYRPEIDGDHDLAARDFVLGWWGDRPALIFGTWKQPRPTGTRHLLIWDKGEASGMGDLSLPWKPNVEEIYVLGRGFAGHRGTSVLRGHATNTQAKGRSHPHEKPVGLIRQLLEKCPPGPVIDPYMGSGPVARACADLGRRYVGIELVEDYCAVAVGRLAQQALPLGA